MKVLHTIFLWLFFVISLFFSSFVNANLQWSATQLSNWIKLDWNAVDGVDLYRIDYWNTSWNYTDSVDFLEETSYTFTNLPWSSLYYFSIVWYDNLWREWFRSPEITSATSSSWPLFVVESKMVDEDKVELTFSNNISTTSWSDFIIESVSNSNDFYDAIETQINSLDSKKIIITLDWKPKVWDEYKIVVLSILDEFNQNIQFWVDSETVFTAISNFDLNYLNSDAYFWNNSVDVWNNNQVTDLVEQNNNSNTWTNQSSVNENNLQLNSADENVIIPTNVWVEINSEDVNSNLLNVASENDRLPQTWPAELLLLILALIFGSFIFLNRYKRA